MSVLEMPLTGLTAQQVAEIENLVALARDGNEIAGQRLAVINEQTFALWLRVRQKSAPAESKATVETANIGRGLSRIQAALAASKKK